MLSNRVDLKWNTTVVLGGINCNFLVKHYRVENGQVSPIIQGFDTLNTASDYVKMQYEYSRNLYSRTGVVHNGKLEKKLAWIKTLMPSNNLELYWEVISNI